jgi:hypothetical protein
MSDELGTPPVDIFHNGFWYNRDGGGGPVQQDPVTGQLLGPLGVVQIGGSTGVSGVTYNGSNQVTGFTVGGVTYTVTYPASQIVVTASTGSVQTINLDGSGRIQSVT